MAITLPHPHGDGPGQIANNAQYAIDDTPGSDGGRFVGFGEPGSSRIANRAAWALSENIDRIFTDVLSVPITVNTAVSFVADGDNSYHLTGSVFCGDGTYPGSPPTDVGGMRILFDVLDEQYNNLTDPNGNEVRVYEVKDTTDATSVYQGGFVTDPWVHFCTVNPVTGAVVQNPYMIGGGTVRIVFGVQSTIKDLPTDHPDAFTRFRSISGEDVPAGVVLQDGTRAMVGDLNMGSQDITYCTDIKLASISPTTPGAVITVNTSGMNLISEPESTAYIQLNYVPSGLETGVRSIATSDWRTDDGNVVYKVTLYADPASPSTYSNVNWQMWNSHGSIGMTLDYSLYWRTLRPLTDMGLGLGTASYRWGSCFLDTIYVRDLDLDTSRSLRTNDGARPILLEDGLDHRYFSDFQDAMINANAGNIRVDENLRLYGTGAQTFSYEFYAWGCLTAASLLTEDAVNGRAQLVAPRVRYLTQNACNLRIRLALNMLSGGPAPNYRFSCGFGSSSDPESSFVYCYVYMDDLNQLCYTWDDGAGHANTYTSGIYLVAGGRYYTIELRFNTDDTFQVYLDDNPVGVPITFAPGNADFYCTPLQVTNETGGSSIIVYVDWIDLHSEGHMSRFDAG